MNAAAFLLSLGRRTHNQSPALDPLKDARDFLAANGDTAEGQALRKVLRAITNTDGDFADMEVWLFSDKTLALVAALVHERLENRYSLKEWRGAN